MKDSITIHTPLSELIWGCQNEAHLNQRDEVGFCFELFCRAVEGEDGDAWTAVQNQYYNLVFHWVRGFGELDTDEIEYLAQDTFIKFWKTLQRQKQKIRQKFKHIGALLKYLKRCTMTAYLDRQRQRQREAQLKEKLATESGHLTYTDDNLLDNVATLEQVEKLRLWLNKHVTDLDEQLVLKLIYEQGLSLKEIVKMRPDKFSTSRDVHRIRERILKRAKRNFV